MPSSVQPSSRGTIKWFDSKKHFGFIHFVSEPQAFFHEREIIKGKLLPYAEGEVVECQVLQNERGPAA